MAVQDYSSTDRWQIVREDDGWVVYEPNQDSDQYANCATFAEARAAYLDAVTCESTYDATKVASIGTVVRCIKSRGHDDRWHECATGGWTQDNSGAVFVG